MFLHQLISVIPSVAEESRGNESGGLFTVILNAVKNPAKRKITLFMRLRLDVSTTLNITVERVFHFIHSSVVPYNASARCFDKLNMTENKRSAQKRTNSYNCFLYGRPPVARHFCFTHTMALQCTLHTHSSLSFRA